MKSVGPPWGFQLSGGPNSPRLRPDEFGAITLPALARNSWRRRACACEAHCRPPRALGPLDVVLPFAITNNSTGAGRGPRRGGRRDLLAVFVGSKSWARGGGSSSEQIEERWPATAVGTRASDPPEDPADVCAPRLCAHVRVWGASVQWRCGEALWRSVVGRTRYRACIVAILASGARATRACRACLLTCCTSCTCERVLGSCACPCTHTWSCSASWRSGRRGVLGFVFCPRPRACVHTIPCTPLASTRSRAAGGYRDCRCRLAR